MADGSEVTGSPVELDNKPADATVTELSDLGGSESTCNNIAATSAERSEVERDEENRYSELMAKGDVAFEGQDYSEATDCYSRALEIRATLFGELDPRCVNAYYKYGSALLYKAQEEADPLVSVPKRDEDSLQNSCKDEPAKSTVSAESSAASVENSNEEGGTLVQNEKETNNNDAKLKGVEENEEEDESEAEDTSEGDEDESDLDLAWKMLDLARAIVEKTSEDTMQKVEILSALAEVALEREDVETSVNDYLKALSILERIVEPDSRRIAELNFRICLCLEIGSKPQEAIPYCQKAISVCKSRVERLKTESSTEKETETLTDLCSELEKKLEELKQLVLNPTSILQDILGIFSAKTKNAEKSLLSASRIGTVNSSGGFDSPTGSTAHTGGSGGVTDLGVVGRGVKRVHLDPVASEAKTDKRPSLDPPPSNGHDSNS